MTAAEVATAIEPDPCADVIFPKTVFATDVSDARNVFGY